jgi:hypothetical protein
MHQWSRYAVNRRFEAAGKFLALVHLTLLWLAQPAFTVAP